MNTKPTTESADELGERAVEGDDQVVVEELIIEEYQAAVPPPVKERSRALRRVRSHPKSTIATLLSFGALVIATIFAGRHRKAPLLKRVARRVGIPV